MRKIKKIIFCGLCFVLMLSVSSCNIFKKEADPSTFDEYTKELFLIIMGDDEMTNHFLFKDPTKFGLAENATVSLPTPTTGSGIGKFLINLCFGDIYNYDYDKLNFDQQMTYNVIANLLEGINDETKDMAYMESSYLGSYLGYQAQLPLLLSEYRFDNEKDIENYFAIIDLVPTTFKSYVEFEVEKADKGYGMPDFVIDKVINQCNEFIDDVEQHFLIETFDERVEVLDFLTSSEKEECIAKNYEKVTTSLVDGYKYVAENLGSIYGKAKNNLGLSHYENGKKYYQLLFKSETGYDVSIEEAIAYIENKLTNSYDTIKKFVKDNATFIADIEKNLLMNTDPLNQINEFKNQIEGHFPSVDVYPTINIEYIDKSMENHFSPAAYMTSPIDDYSNEYIYLNNASIAGDYNYLYHTLAHEGVPGHLYQNIYFKNQDVNVIRKVLKSSGYTEGWATYAEMYMLDLVAGENELLAKYLKYNDEFSGALQCRLDMGIHYEGWDLDDVHGYLNKYLNGYTKEDAKRILEQLIEVPTNTQIYFFTYFKMRDMYDKAKAALGSEFDEVEFHKVILDCGPVPLRYVEEVVDEYISR